MQSFVNRYAAALLLGAGAAALGVWLWLRPPADLRAFDALKKDWDADRCLALARRHPRTTGGLAALLLACPASAEARSLLEEWLPDADPRRLADALARAEGGWERERWLAPLLLARAREGHPDGGRLAAAACVAAHAEDEPSAAYSEAADLIASRYPGSEGLERFCDGLAGPWAPRFERHLAAIRAANRHPAVRASATFALACLLQADPARKGQAANLFQQLVLDAEGTEDRPATPTEKRFGSLARARLAELKGVTEEASTAKPALAAE
ncbi:MAG: hypothetical protein K2W96_04805 [Gemmataceae bacterium]|nr:hypothetical protein [Gemmataceae bacterium]